MEPEVVTTFHIYPVACEDMYRYTIISEIEEMGLDGVTIKYEERPYSKYKHRPYKEKSKITLDLTEAKLLYKALGKIISKEALVQAEASEALNS